MEELEIFLWNQCTIDSGLLYSNNLFPWDFKPVVLLADGLLREMWEAAAGRERLFIYLCTLLLEISKSAQTYSNRNLSNKYFIGTYFLISATWKECRYKSSVQFYGWWFAASFQHEREIVSVFREDFLSVWCKLLRVYEGFQYEIEIVNVLEGFSYDWCTFWKGL